MFGVRPWLFAVRCSTFALSTFAASVSWSQPAGPRRLPGATYDPYQPLVRQGDLPDEVLSVLRGIRFLPDEIVALLPAPVRIGAKGGAVTPPSVPTPTPGNIGLPGPVRHRNAADMLPAPEKSADSVDIRFRALLQVCRAARDGHRFEEAEVIAADLVKQADNPKSRYAAQLELAACWHFNGKNAEAVTLLRELLTREEPDASEDAAMWTRYYLGAALIMLEKWEEAIPILEASIAHLPEPPCGYWHHVYRLRLLYRTHRCYLALGDLDNSARCLGQYVTEAANDNEREARENVAVFEEVLRLHQTRLEVAGLADGAIDLGTVPAGRAGKRTCTILKPRTSDVEVTCDVPFVRPRVGDQRWGCGRCEQRIHFDFPADAPLGAFAGTVTITSRPPVEARVVVPLHGEVR